jgi:enoyl-CoA hydratase
MEKDAFIQSDIDGPVGVLLINRPHKANAYTDAMILRAHEAVDRFVGDPAIRSLVIASAAPGRFCAGADLSEIRARKAADGFTVPSLAFFDRLASLPIPVVAAVGGPAVAGGLELALACDVRVASPAARFALPETRLGILPAAGATWRLPAAVGQSMAREMILLGRSLDADEALAAGLVSAVVPEDALRARALEIARRAADLDRDAVAAAKDALSRAGSGDDGRAFVAETQARFYGRRQEGPS